MVVFLRLGHGGPEQLNGSWRLKAGTFLATPFGKPMQWLLAEGLDPDELRYGAIISVWVRWSWVISGLIEINYPAGYQDRYYALNTLYVLTPAVINGYVFYRIRSGQMVPAVWLLGLSALDIFWVSFSLSMTGGFASSFYPGYLVVLATFAVVFTSIRLSCAWATLVAVVYTVLSLTVGAGVDFEANDEKQLFQRILALYAITCVVSLVARYERIRRRAAVAREQQLQWERIQLSQTIHDSVGQSAYMIGIGIDHAKSLAGSSQPQLTTSLEATGQLARWAIWSLRHPIDVGVIFEGQALGTTLSSHAATFTAVSSIPAEVEQLGVEPALPVATKSLLFSIAHNAMTNVFRHAQAGRVDIVLDFRQADLVVSVTDDGVGLPEDYQRRGHGFRNMRADAELLGGVLEVANNDSGAGATVACRVPFQPSEGGE